MSNYNFTCSCGASCSISLSDRALMSVEGKPMTDWLKTHQKCVSKKREFYKLPIKRNRTIMIEGK